MQPVNRALTTLLSIFSPWIQPDLTTVQQSRLVRSTGSGVTRPDSLPAARPQHHKPDPTLETLNADVFRLIALELRGKQTLHQLASSSRALRTLVSPILFSRCQLPSRQGKNPPSTISSYVRHLRVCQTSDSDYDIEAFESLINSFPYMIAITFDEGYQITWDLLKKCIAHPRIHTLSFGTLANFTAAGPASVEAVTISKFSCHRNFWLEVINAKPAHRHTRPIDLDDVFSREATSLLTLVPGMGETARRLALMMETAPIPSMAGVPWPNLRDFSIEGRYLNQAQAESLPLLLSSLPELERLSIRICRRATIGRAPVLGRSNFPPTVLSGLRFLTVAYPDPDDDIFAIDTTNLLHLSLRDCPRHYNAFARHLPWTKYWAYPILSSVECLSILKRINAPHLSSLELVYRVDSADLDDELLQYIVEAYPELSHLEVHRYRADRTEEVNHKHIARLLTPLKSLRTIHLNLDFHDDHGAYCKNLERRAAWFETFKNERGPEIINILQDCPWLEYVGLLYHGIPQSTWVEFHPFRCAEPRFVLEYDSAHVDSVPIPYNWYSPLMYLSRFTTSGSLY